MAGHTITPYELYATRKRPRKEEDGTKRLLLAAELTRDGTLDLLDVLSDHVLEAAPSVANDQSRSVTCVDVHRHGEMLDLVFACDVTGEREVVRDPAEGVVVFMKDAKHVARYFSCCRVWRPANGDQGLVLIHSPWGRGGSKNQILAVLQRAVNAEEGAAAKLRAHPKIPQEVLEEWLKTLNATKITYLKPKGIRSRFETVAGARSAPAEMAVVVKGSDTIPFRDALTHAFRASQDRQAFFTVEMRNSDGSYSDEKFEDVEITIDLGAGHLRTYSMRKETVPTVGFDLTVATG
jgi:hypothetical protein